jgi:hypothetical protein
MSKKPPEMAGAARDFFDLGTEFGFDKHGKLVLLNVK